MLANRFSEKLERLEKIDARRTIFGASAHDYRLGVCMSVAAIEAIESRTKIRLPEDYREFLTQVGNGGAGPFYGVFPWGVFDGSGSDATWAENDGLVGILREPFPHTEEWNLSAAELEQPEFFEHDAAEDAWHAALDEKYWDTSLVNGAIPIAHHGCALRTWLVVSGAERGHVWYDARAEYGGLLPHLSEVKKRLTFGDWYEHWLDSSIRALAGTSP